MKKTFKLTSPTKATERQIDAIRYEIKKYIARERRKTLPEDIDFWDFDCRIGNNDQDASVIHISEINSKIEHLASENKDSFYLEILAKPGHRTKK